MFAANSLHSLLTISKQSCTSDSDTRPYSHGAAVPQSMCAGLYATVLTQSSEGMFDGHDAFSVKFDHMVGQRQFSRLFERSINIIVHGKHRTALITVASAKINNATVTSDLRPSKVENSP